MSIMGMNGATDGKFTEKFPGQLVRGLRCLQSVKSGDASFTTPVNVVQLLSGFFSVGWDLFIL